jgi:hypothetical protein
MNAGARTIILQIEGLEDLVCFDCFGPLFNLEFSKLSFLGAS